ncbi:MAG: carboxypeptidase-like regulatory domain-containing protein, partial [Acidobacteriota bacterium]
MAKIFFGRHLLRAIIMIALFCSFIWSQTGSSSVTGSVTDAQGNAVPGATVTLVSQQNTRRSTVTSNNGLFTLTSVVPGVYKVEVGAVGFKRSHVSAFQALVDKPTEINLRLEVGEVSETVTVDASSIENIVNTQDASLGNNFVSQQIQQLPLNARNVANLLSLQAAVTPDGSVAGGRADQANITLDGIDVNDQQTGLDFTGAAFAPVLRVNPDSVDEFRVTTSNPDASKGRSAGAQISLITKSGTNSF